MTGPASPAPEEAFTTAYITFLESFKPADLDRLGEAYTEDVRFKDPFNDAQGIEKLRAIYADMFEKLSGLDFKVTGSAVRPGGCYLTWTLKAKLGKTDWVVDGMSDIRFAGDGKVSAHIDYWDAASGLYERLPVIGPLARWLRRRIEV